VRVEVEDVEDLLGSLTQATMHFTAMRREVDAISQARRQAAFLVRQMHSIDQFSNGSAGRNLRPIADDLVAALDRADRGFTAGAERVERELAQTQERANRLRLLPSSAIFPSLERTARDAAVGLGKQVQWESSGGEIRLDAQVLVVLRDTLMHLVRNALAHGIETPEVRTAAGKSPRGLVEIKVERQGNRVTFICRDDGAGIDVAAIRRTAVMKGVIPAASAESLGLDQAIELILRGGLSTTGSVTGISGRGIGLDVVRSATERLKGKVSVSTAAGRGTTVEVSVPVSLTAVLALMVESGETVAAIPLDAVRRTLRVSGREIALSGTRRLISFEGRAVPFLPLPEALGHPDSAGSNREFWSCVLVSSGSELGLIGVDRLLGTGTVLVRSLAPLVAAGPAVAGASLDGEGNPQLVLDPAGLIEAAHGAALHAPAAPKGPRPPILVIDDSLTTRMVEQSILESAGHQVELATSAEEALDKARLRRYSLFLVDVEMPGMNGFDFIARTQEDPWLREIPSILVTSRNSADDKRRGQEAGSRAYIVKSEFNQEHLLQTIEQLMA
jgi:two-component system chemotaxis sensor kinase CheA